MFAVMIPATTMVTMGGATWVIAGLFLAVLVLTNLPKAVPVRRLVYAGVLAWVVGIGLAVVPQIIIRCQPYWWFC